MKFPPTLAYLTLRGIVYFAQTLDDEEADSFGAALGRMFYRLGKSRQTIARENLVRAFPELEDSPALDELTLRVFENLGRNLAEVARFPLYSVEKRLQMITIERDEILHEIAARKCGCMLLTPHFGNWELIGSWLPAHNYPTSFLAGAQTNSSVNRLLNDLRRHIGVKIIQTGSSARPVISALRRGEFIGIVPDQHAAIGHEVVEFFGQKVAAHRGPALFAYRTGAAILPGFLVRKAPARHVGWVEDPIFADRSRPEAAEVSAITQRVMTLFEKAIRKYPESWMWTHRRWKPLPGSQNDTNHI